MIQINGTPRALTVRADLLEAECRSVRERRLTWRGRLKEMGEYGAVGGGSAADRRAIVEFMASVERAGR